MFYGAQYYRPPFPKKECWERDIRHMKELGFTCVKFWAVWNWIEREEGYFDFSDLDELVELARNCQLEVIINTIPEGAPYWTYNGNREDLYQTADGQVVEYGGPANLPSGGWPGLCMDNQEFAEKTAAFIEMTARHFAEEAAVIAIDVWNEPHLEPMYDYRSHMLCYCKHSRAEFTVWLKNKYQTLENLNKAWYRTYTSWQQVAPPPRFGTWADMLDWRKFWLENLRRWLRLRVEACRRGAPGKMVQTHVAYSGILGNRIAGGLANELGDEFLLAKEVDWFGLSSFPKWLMGKEHIYRHLLHNEMIAAAAGGACFYQVELQGGAGKPGLLGGEVPDERDIMLWNWNTVAAGGKGSVYWQYAPEPAGVESPGFGLTGFQGEDTPRSIASGKMAREFCKDWLDEARMMPVVNGIYVSRDSDLICFSADRKEELYAKSLSGIYKAAYKAGIPVRFFHQDDIEELPESGIHVLYLPMALVLSHRETEILQEFVFRGGTLVSEACPGLYREDGMLEQEGYALETLFGVKHREIQGMPEWGPVSVWQKDGRRLFTGELYRQVVTCGSLVTVLAEFNDGEAALIEHVYGQGKAVWIGTYAGYHYEVSDDENTGALLRRWMIQAGYECLEEIKISGTREKIGIDKVVLAPVIRLMRSGEQYIVVALNHTYDELDIQISMKGRENQCRFHLEASEGRFCFLNPEDGGLYDGR